MESAFQKYSLFKRCSNKYFKALHFWFIYEECAVGQSCPLTVLKQRHQARMTLNRLAPFQHVVAWCLSTETLPFPAYVKYSKQLHT